MIRVVPTTPTCFGSSNTRPSRRKRHRMAPRALAIRPGGLLATTRHVRRINFPRVAGRRKLLASCPVRFTASLVVTSFATVAADFTRNGSDVAGVMRHIQIYFSPAASADPLGRTHPRPTLQRTAGPKVP